MSVFGVKPRDAREGMTLISADAFFHGTLAVKGSLRVEGVFEGDISDAVGVEVGASGRILGDVAAESVAVAGEVVGNIVAAVCVELLSGARLSGDIRTPKLRVDEGAIFDGACAMGDGSQKPRRRRGQPETDVDQPVDPVSQG